MQGTPSSATRRSFLKTTGVLGAVGMYGQQASGAAGSSSASLATTSATSEDTLSRACVLGPDQTILGGDMIVGRDGYDTIQGAWDDAHDGDTVHVHSSYDAEAAGEQFPIVLDYSEKEVMVSGGHPSGSVVDASHASEDIFHVEGVAQYDYRNHPILQNLKLVGGNVGLRIKGAPHNLFQNLVVFETGSHGITLEEGTGPDGDSLGSFGNTFLNCQVWNAGGDGFREFTAANPHATNYAYCKAMACQGVGFRLRGFMTKVQGGDAELNHSYGFDIRSGQGIHLSNVYIEGNARDEDYPLEVYGKNAHGLVIEGCYLHGINPRTTTHSYDWVQRGINVHDSRHVVVQNCTMRRYGDGGIALFGCADADVHIPSQNCSEADLLAKDPIANGCTRVRSDGVILPQDLAPVEGSFEGDQGYHVDGSDISPAVWYGGEWHVAATQTLSEATTQ
ncbi:right-handed parallel beta-helix repeat-containing protein [Haloglomus halophilum]|uniref:right-handed parallel beta-helix repeat-containing protein n=1 Tax=Haloglomus halophilum TaxID=2962672 RepID=UPI0020CA0F69|nr:right-handed parallel beta-helix repeat-containing protein [Haloglomus halophilum]